MKILYLFGGAVFNQPECILDAQYTKRGRIEHHFYAMRTVSIVFIEVKKSLVMGRRRLDVIAQVLAECTGVLGFNSLQLLILITILMVLACDYANSKRQHWVPILAIVCDGRDFEFLVYDSGTKSIYSTRSIIGVVDVRNSNDLLLPSVKRSKVADNCLPLFNANYFPFLP
jgi:hypothetical protein